MKVQSNVLDCGADQAPPTKGRPPRRCSCLLPLLVAVPVVLCAQSSQISFERLSQAHGLLGNEVHCILQDSHGYMWFGTEKGLNMYDGTGFTVYKHQPGNPSSIVDAKIQSLWEDKQGILWLGTWNGLERFDRATGSFSHFLPEPQSSPDDWSNVIYDLCEDRKGTLWLGGKGLKSFDRSTGKFTFLHHTVPAPHKLIENYVDAVYEDGFGELWVGAGGALERFDRSTQSYTLYWIDQNIAKGLDPDRSGFHWIQKIYEDRSGLLWLCTDGGPVALDRKTGKFKPYHIYRGTPDSITNRSVSSIIEDDAGQLWIGAWGEGYLTFNARADSFEAHSLTGYSSNNSVCALYKDKTGTIWIGTNGDGVIKVTREQKRFTALVRDPAEYPNAPYRIPAITSSIQDNDVRFIYQADSGLVSIGTGTGGDGYDPRKGTVEHAATWDWPYPISGGLHSRFAPVWYTGVLDVVNKVYDSPYRRIEMSLADSGFGGSACSFFEDRRGIVWMLVSAAGVIQFDPRTNSFKKLGIGSPQPFIAARMFIEDSLDGSPTGWGLWIGSSDGLWYYDAGLDAFKRYGHDAKDSHSLSSNTVTTVFRDGKGTLWVGTDQGLNRMDQTAGTFERFTIDQGLPENAVQGILEDRSGRIWISTTSTLAKLDPQSGRFSSYQVNGVIPGVRFAAGCCLYSDRQEAYFGGNGGIVAFNPDSIRENAYVPPIVITGFKVFDVPIALDSVIGEKKSIEISYNENVFSAEFAALSYIHQESNQYAYYLEGHDTSWTYCGSRQFARYSNVGPGAYTLRVKGSNNDGVWNEEGTSLAIVITPPWWKTTWFTIGLWAMAAFSMGGTIRYVERKKLKKRIAQLEKEQAVERERTRISQDMHDEVGSSLSEIAILSELAKKKPDEAGEHVQEISERTAELIDNVSEIVWAMNPKNDTLDNLVGHVRRFGVKYLSHAGITCQFSAPEDVPAKPLTAELRRNLFLVVKEVLHNIVKHSGASVAMITLALHEEELAMRIEDNGKGFRREELPHGGNGLGNMHKRIADVGGTLTIESQPGCGTKVAMRVKL